jgi:hypothetical protein
MVDSRPGPDTVCHPAEDPLLSQARLDSFPPNAFGKTLHPLGGCRRNSSIEAIGNPEKLMDRGAASGLDRTQEAARPIEKVKITQRSSSLSNSILPRERRHCDASFKRLEGGTFRFPALPPAGQGGAYPRAGEHGLVIRAADLAMLWDGVDLASVKRRPRYRRSCPPLAVAGIH